MDHKQKAVDYFSKDLHCSQSVLAAFAFVFILPRKPRHW